MSIPAAGREKVALCGPRVVRRVEGIGVRGLDELADRDFEELVLAVDDSVGAPIGHRPMATRAMTKPGLGVVWTRVRAAMCSRRSTAELVGAIERIAAAGRT